MPRRSTALVFSLLLAGCRASAPLLAAEKPPPRPSAVRLICLNFISMEAVEASGFFVTQDRLLVTCAHVVKGTVPIGVTLPDGTDAPVAELAASSPPTGDGEVLCRERLVGVLRHYYRRAA